MPNYAVLIAAAGQSSRFNDPGYKKPFIKLQQKPVWLHSVEKFQKRSDVKQVIIVVAPDDEEEFMTKFGANVAVLPAARAHPPAGRFPPLSRHFFFTFF